MVMEKISKKFFVLGNSFGVYDFSSDQFCCDLMFLGNTNALSDKSNVTASERFQGSKICRFLNCHTYQNIPYRVFSLFEYLRKLCLYLLKFML
eukprot:TRINITY_DN91531_c0_g1_i1.p1 TRINITY_DN91531_c0_g1~~TRINITY_DN91531_c0_g1_i1.p1  ORF type:complete len:104 (-),score=5.25 TRINITY_DN91531_c0_g1_i1:80-358(-)